MLGQSGKAQLVMRPRAPGRGDQRQGTIQQRQQFNRAGFQGQVDDHMGVEPLFPRPVESVEVDGGQRVADQGGGLRFGLADQAVHEGVIDRMADSGKGLQTSDQCDTFGVDQGAIQIEEDRVGHFVPLCCPCGLADQRDRRKRWPWSARAMGCRWAMSCRWAAAPGGRSTKAVVPGSGAKRQS